MNWSWTRQVAPAICRLTISAHEGLKVMCAFPRARLEKLTGGTLCSHSTTPFVSKAEPRSLLRIRMSYARELCDKYYEEGYWRMRGEDLCTIDGFGLFIVCPNKFSWMNYHWAIWKPPDKKLKTNKNDLCCQVF